MSCVSIKEITKIDKYYFYKKIIMSNLNYDDFLK